MALDTTSAKAELATKVHISMFDHRRTPEPDTYQEQKTIIHSEGDDVPSWIDLLEDSRGLIAIYRDHTPMLHSITVHQVALHRDGPRLALRFDLRDFPEDPPKKWAISGFNTVQLEMMFVDVRSVTINGWGTNSIASMDLTRYDRWISGVVTSPVTKISVEAATATITKISAYLSDEARAW